MPPVGFENEGKSRSWEGRDSVVASSRWIDFFATFRVQRAASPRVSTLMIMKV